MSKALRGDFERLRGRGVATTLALNDEPVTAQTVTDSAPGGDESPEPAIPAAVEDVADAARPGWLDRMLGRG